MSREKKTGCLGGCMKYILGLVAVIALCIYFVDVDIDSDIKGGGTASVDVTEDTYCAYYPLLTDTEKVMYDALLEAVRNGKLECRIDNVDYDVYVEGFGRAAVALTYDHPELFWIQGSSTCRGSQGFGGSGGYVEITLECYDYWQYTINPEKYVTALNNEVERVAGLAAGYATDYEKAKFVHDYLVTSAEYDHEALAESEKTIHDAASEYIYSAYGCLVNKKTVCAGYAKAFQMIMNKLDVPCTFVVGDSYSGEHHGWNRLEMEGESYYVDVTWDDADRKDDQGNFRYPDEAEYDYFGLTTEALERDHIIEKKYFKDVPCRGTANNYFVRNEYELDTYTFQAVADIIDRQAAQDVASIRFTSAAAYRQAMADLFDANTLRVWEIPSLKSCKGLQYTSNDTQYVITFLK